MKILNLRGWWTRFCDWVAEPASPKPLAYFRMAVALFCIVKMWIIRASILDLYGQYGFIQWAITRANLYDGLPHLGNVSRWLSAVGLTADQSVYLLSALYIGALLALLAGLFTRWMAVIAWAINFLWMHAGGGLIYGVDIFAHIGLFYLMIMPAGDYLSLDTWRSGAVPAPSMAAGLTRRMLQLHLCIIYVSSGWEKAMGIQWWNGEAIWRSVMLPAFRQFDMSWLARWPWLAAAAGWTVILTEAGYGLFIWCRRTRLIWLVLMLGFHLSIGLFLGMWLFASIMIILNCGAFGYEALHDAKDRLSLFRRYLSLFKLAPHKRGKSLASSLPP